MPHPTKRPHWRRARLGRGIYALEYGSRSGHDQLVAVDRNGNEIAKALVFEGECECEVAAQLERILDEFDPT